MVFILVSVFDVVAYILEKCGAMSAMKLQKLCYYAQAWSLVWEDEPLFHERIEAWTNGPVIPVLYQRHKGIFKIEVGSLGGNSKILADTQKETINAVCDAYSKLNAQQLSDLTHSEAPWQKARTRLNPFERGHEEISLADMSEYYSSLPE